jgi:hypothetical protein
MPRLFSATNGVRSVRLVRALGSTQHAGVALASWLAKTPYPAVLGRLSA